MKTISIFLNPCPKFNLIRCLSYRSNYNNNDDDDDDDKATTRLKMETSLKTKVAVLSWPASQGGQLYENILRRIYNQRKNI